MSVTHGDVATQLRETGQSFLPKFDANGLITAIVSETSTGEALMVAHVNREAIELCLATGEAHFYSRSRKQIWHKGATSGNVLKIDSIHIDCDQDAIWLSVEPMGHKAACHTGRKSCFYRKIVIEDGTIVLEPTGGEPQFDPEKVYGS